MIAGSTSWPAVARRVSPPAATNSAARLARTATPARPRGDQIVGDEGRFVGRDEGGDLRERHLRERHRAENDRGGDEYDRAREPALAAPRAQGRQEYQAPVCQLARHVTIVHISQ